MSITQRLKGWLGLAESDTEAAERSPARPQAPEVPVIGLEGGQAAFNEGAHFVDVREDAEWADGHIAGAVHHPVGPLEQAPRLAVAADTPVVTYCAAGIRAARAAAALVDNGYNDVRVLQVGYGDWREAGLPVEGDPNVRDPANPSSS